VTDSCEPGSKVAPSPELLARVRAWLAVDPDRESRDELKKLIACNDGAAMADRFAGRLAFGTAGLRGVLGAGPNRMNRVVVAQASAGLSRYLQSSAGAKPRIVIGCDARKNSEVFARDAAEIMAGAGCEVLLLPAQLPTPVLAFAVRHLRADAGVMITASHNPAGDNGYKVYLGGESDGAQIVSPVDREIEALIEEASRTPFDKLPRGRYDEVGSDLLEAYVHQTASLAPALASSKELTVVYTPMHGVGLATFAAVLDAAEYPLPVVVTEQAEPDPNFSTVAFPNPEEAGALDLAMATARKHQADLILANDPDGDRLAVAVAQGDDYRVLTGDELGVLLGWWSLERSTQQGRSGAVATSVVSAPALERLAERYGVNCQRTLSGFKWIGRVHDLIYGYEEALGYLVNPHTVRDKDGISAALAVLDVAHSLAAAGSSIAQKVDELATELGGVYGSSFSIRTSTPDDLTALMTRLRGHAPATLAGRAVFTVDDYSHGLAGLPATNLLAWHLDDGARVMVRPSGTEPKLKFYVHADTVSEAEAIAASVRSLASGHLAG
jgi:phosphomannomutase